MAEIKRFSPEEIEIIETKNTSERIVIYGSRGSGIYELTNELVDFIDKKDINFDVTTVRHIETIKDAFFHESPEKMDEIALPIGVIIFPEMRAVVGSGNMTVDTPYEFIEKLCEENNVPFFRVSLDRNKKNELQSIAEALKQKTIEKE